LYRRTIVNTSSLIFESIYIFYLYTDIRLRSMDRKISIHKILFAIAYYSAGTDVESKQIKNIDINFSRIEKKLFLGNSSITLLCAGINNNIIIIRYRIYYDIRFGRDRIDFISFSLNSQTLRNNNMQLCSTQNK